MIGGLFLMLSYFGCDQSQVQRYLTAKSIDEARHSLLMSAYVKIPLQLLILSSGVLVFVFYLFQTPPMLFNRAHDAQVASSPQGGGIRGAPADRSTRRSPIAPRGGRARRPRGVSGERRARQGHPRAGPPRSSSEATGDERYTDVNYVFPTFITTHMPIGLVGLMIAAIFAAAMSASGGELNALATATIIDFYQPPLREDRRAMRTTCWCRSWRRSFWGLFACVVAMYAANQGSLIEVVNRYGSFFYGSLLGVFILAILTKRATAAGAFWGLLAGMAVVLTVAFQLPWIAFLWHNLIGAVVVVVVGMAISYTQPAPTPRVESISS